VKGKRTYCYTIKDIVVVVETGGMCAVALSDDCRVV